MFNPSNKYTCKQCIRAKTLNRCSSLPPAPITGTKLCKDPECIHKTPQDVTNFPLQHRGTSRMNHCRKCILRKHRERGYNKRNTDRTRTSCELRWNNLQKECLRKYGVEAHPDCERLFHKPCYYCGFVPADHETTNGIDRVDSSIPGYSNIDNLVTACLVCNFAKGPLSRHAFLYQIIAINNYRQLNDSHLIGTRNTTLGIYDKAPKVKGTLTSKERRALIEGKECYLCGTQDNMGIDRVVNSLPYIVQNCEPCCLDCNLIKRNLDLHSLLSQVHRIWKNLSLPPHVNRPKPFMGRFKRRVPSTEKTKQCKRCPSGTMHPVENMIGLYCTPHYREQDNINQRKRRIRNGLNVKIVDETEVFTCNVCSTPIKKPYTSACRLLCDAHKKEDDLARKRRERRERVRKRYAGISYVCEVCSIPIEKPRDSRHKLLCDEHKRKQKRENSRAYFHEYNKGRLEQDRIRNRKRREQKRELKKMHKQDEIKKAECEQPVDVPKRKEEVIYTCTVCFIPIEKPNNHKCKLLCDTHKEEQKREWTRAYNKSRVDIERIRNSKRVEYRREYRKRKREEALCKTEPVSLVSVVA